ncbi:hypothetical protein [Streptomyces scabiei]|nr:hypothetical protein [Streptomyces scabiei]
MHAPDIPAVPRLLDRVQALRRMWIQQLTETCESDSPNLILHASGHK